MGDKYKTFAVVLISLFVVGFFLSIYITVEEKIPDNADVIVTEENKLYHSIHFDHICISGKEDAKIQQMSLSQAIAKGYKADPHCQDLGYFKGNRRFLLHHILSKLGMRVNSRWNKNGDWLW